MGINNIDEAERIIEASLEEVRPHLRVDGGDIELVSVSPDGIIEVRFLGECASCSLAIMTLRAGVERVLMHALPSIRRIEMV
ncbi:MAG TPA: NifU family protein [Bacteroidota bacterium]|nr:NifU family protein [Bacteroidota bacterium]